MSQTTPISPLQRADDVAAYVAAVRARLSDLAGDEVEELTGGLEADLAEALSGTNDSPREQFGDPVAYADELRAAADLPPRREPAEGGLAGSLAEMWRDTSASINAQLRALERIPWYQPVRDFLVLLRPAWWVLRAWIAVALLRQIFSANETGIIGGFPASALLVLAIVGSVAIGRHTPLRGAVGRTALLLGNVLAVLLFFPVIGQYAEPPRSVYDEPWLSQPGLWNDGSPVEDIVPYDSQGRPLTGVALYDSYGTPLELNVDFSYPGAPTPPLPGNVFPKGVADDGTAGTDGSGQPVPTEEPTDEGGSSSVETPEPTTPPTVTPTPAASARTPLGTTPAATTPVVTPSQ